MDADLSYFKKKEKFKTTNPKLLPTSKALKPDRGEQLVGLKSSPELIQTVKPCLILRKSGPFSSAGFALTKG